MRRSILAVLAACCLLLGCASQEGASVEMISGSHVLELSSSSSEESPYVPEFPPAVESSAAQPDSSSQEVALSSSQEAAPSAAEPSSGESSSQEESSSASQSSSADSSSEAPPPAAPVSLDESKGVWLSYLEFDTMLKGKSEGAFRSAIANAFDAIAAEGLNTVIVQVRPFGDALYRSEIFPWSYLCTGTEGVNPGFDPLAIMVEAAHSRGLLLEAWVNPYRVRSSGSTVAMSEDNPASLWLEEGSDAVISFDGAISYNPGSAEARQLIVDGVREIVRNYDVDAIHFDDYFYPTTSASFDQETYQEQGGGLSLGDWRRENVNKLVRAVYAAVKEEDPSVLFGISPQGNNTINYDSQYIDVAKWVSTSGYIDYICPQIYFGFEHDTRPFQETLESWNEMISSSSVALRVGIGAYKVGTADTWAGGGASEWIDNSDLLARMVEAGREMSHYGGFALYRYDFLFSSPSGQMEEELANLADIL